MKNNEIPNEIEKMTFPFEIKVLKEDGTFEGYAAIFNKPDQRNQIISPGAFIKTLQEGNTRPLLWWHNPGDPIGLGDLSTDKKGLKVLGRLTLAVKSAAEKYELMKDKVIKGLSIGFRTILEDWIQTKKGTQRIIKEVRLWEVSPCVFPMHLGAQITNVKSEGLGSDFMENIQGLTMEIKAGRVISAKNMKEIKAALTALSKLLESNEPPQGTPLKTKSFLSPIIEAGEIRKSLSEPHPHLFGPILKALENNN